MFFNLVTVVNFIVIINSMSHQPRFDHVSQSQMGIKDAVVHLWPLLLLTYSLPASVPRRVLEATAAVLLLFA